jgi:hypothetical protein
VATTNSTGNLITMNAQGDVARTTSKIRLAGVIAVANSLTGVPRIRITDTAGTGEIVPLAAARTAALVITKSFDPPLEVLGLKAASLANVTVTFQVK